jgi:hypothetical protein
MMLSDKQFEEVKNRIMETAIMAGIKPFENDLALLMIDMKTARHVVQTGVAFLENKRKDTAVPYMEFKGALETAGGRKIV